MTAACKQNIASDSVAVPVSLGARGNNPSPIAEAPPALMSIRRRLKISLRLSSTAANQAALLGEPVTSLILGNLNLLEGGVILRE
ncbi:MAG TPA: hypothetical protein VEI95_07205 [Acidobacteriota bacterium]|nr:hypothetical protein [Acidobacteriota bacterium]